MFFYDKYNETRKIISFYYYSRIYTVLKYYNIIAK